MHFVLDTAHIATKKITFKTRYLHLQTALEECDNKDSHLEYIVTAFRQQRVRGALLSDFVKFPLKGKLPR